MSGVRSAPIGSAVEAIESWTPARDLPDGSFVYIDLSAVDQEEKVISAPRELACTDAPSRARQRVRSGDILVSTVRPNLNGVAVVPRELDGATASTGFCVLRPQDGKLHSSYLFHWVKSPAFVSDMVRKATGASYPAVSDRIVQESKIPLPPLQEQRAIAEVLDKVDALRAKRRVAIAQLDALTQSIFVDMFGDLASNPRNWPEAKLGEFAEIISGVTKGRDARGKATRSVPYLAVVNVQDRKLDLSTVKTINATSSEIDRYRLVRNDLLLTEGGDPDKLGRGTLWKEEIPECIHQNHIFRVRITDDRVLRPLFLNWLIGSEYGKRYFLRSAKQTTGIASINMTQLKAFPLLLPPVQLQAEFATRIADVERTRRLAIKASSKSEELFAALQADAFHGKLATRGLSRSALGADASMARRMGM